MQIDYYYTLMSPWAYFGAPRFYAMQQRKAYRMMELIRWHKKLNMPINFMPKYFPPSDVSKASTIILSIDDQQKQNDISFSFLRQMWVEEKDVGDENNIREACNSLDLKFDLLLTVANTKIELYHSLAEKAAQLNVFGSPTYVVNKEIFWGQDRLDFLEEFVDKNQ